ncbi:alpha/beta fold hydrolase [Pediococcus acidilactici]|uniref:alpha/beta hydrolase n=1 Tax=Pediococcus acidilactici TaxID=1254 RepID=UPI002F26DC95
MKKSYPVITASVALLLALGGEIRSVSNVAHAQEVQQSVKDARRQADFNPQQYANEVDSFIKSQTEPNAMRLFGNFSSKEKDDFTKYGLENKEQIKQLWGAGILFNFAFQGHSIVYDDLIKLLPNNGNNDVKLGFFPNTKSEKITLPNQENGGTIQSVAYFTPHKEGSPNVNKTVVMHGGYRGNVDKGYDLDEAGVFYNLGYNILYVDNRSTSQSTGDYVTFGQYEADDVIAWINHLNEIKPGQEVVLYGGSMGAATMMSVLAKAHPDNIKGLIENCGFANIGNQLTYSYNLLTRTLASQSKLIAEYLKGNFSIASDNAQEMLSTMDQYYIKPQANVDINAALPIKGVGSSLPKLLIHGTMDNIVPYDNMNTLMENSKGDTTEMRAEGAGHGEAQKMYPERYERTVDNFLNDVVFKTK